MSVVRGKRLPEKGKLSDCRTIENPCLCVMVVLPADGLGRTGVVPKISFLQICLESVVPLTLASTTFTPAPSFCTPRMLVLVRKLACHRDCLNHLRERGEDAALVFHSDPVQGKPHIS